MKLTPKEISNLKVDFSGVSSEEEAITRSQALKAKLNDLVNNQDIPENDQGFLAKAYDKKIQEIENSLAVHIKKWGLIHHYFPGELTKISVEFTNCNSIKELTAQQNEKLKQLSVLKSKMIDAFKSLGFSKLESSMEKDLSAKETQINQKAEIIVQQIKENEKLFAEIRDLPVDYSKTQTIDEIIALNKALKKDALDKTQKMPTNLGMQSEISKLLNEKSIQIDKGLAHHLTAKINTLRDSADFSKLRTSKEIHEYAAELKKQVQTIQNSFNLPEILKSAGSEDEIKTLLGKCSQTIDEKKLAALQVCMLRKVDEAFKSANYQDHLIKIQIKFNNLVERKELNAERAVTILFMELQNCLNTLKRPLTPMEIQDNDFFEKRKSQYLTKVAEAMNTAYEDLKVHRGCKKILEWLAQALNAIISSISFWTNKPYSISVQTDSVKKIEAFKKDLQVLQENKDTPSSPKV